MAIPGLILVGRRCISADQYHPSRFGIGTSGQAVEAQYLSI